MVGFGIPIKEFSFGNTLIAAGAPVAVGGLIIIGLGAVVSKLRQLNETLNAQAPLAAAPNMFEATIPPRAIPPAADLPFPRRPRATEPERPLPPRASEASGPVPEKPFGDAPVLPNPEPRAGANRGHSRSKRKRRHGGSNRKRKSAAAGTAPAADGPYAAAEANGAYAAASGSDRRAGHAITAAAAERSAWPAWPPWPASRRTAPGASRPARLARATAGRTAAGTRAQPTEPLRCDVAGRRSQAGQACFRRR